MNTYKVCPSWREAHKWAVKSARVEVYVSLGLWVMQKQANPCLLVHRRSPLSSGVESGQHLESSLVVTVEGYKEAGRRDVICAFLRCRHQRNWYRAQHNPLTEHIPTSQSQQEQGWRPLMWMLWIRNWASSWSTGTMELRGGSRTPWEIRRNWSTLMWLI